MTEPLMRAMDELLVNDAEGRIALAISARYAYAEARNRSIKQARKLDAGKFDGPEGKEFRRRLREMRKRGEDV